jgi:hypothetical protein
MPLGAMSASMKVRRALIGFSSPLGYDYFHQASRAPADRQDSPNPILDSAFGLMVLFDELLFVTRSLCPKNMRGLPFVRFLDEEGFRPNIEVLEWTRIREMLQSDPRWRDIDVRGQERPSYSEIVTSAGVAWSGVDNHSHGLDVAGLHVMANPDSFNLVRDFLILEQLAADNIELVTNSLTQPYLEPKSTALPQARLTELLTVRQVHNYLSVQGPYHPVIDEARENQYLKDFRRWIVERHTSLSLSEVRDVQLAVESAIQELQDRVFLKHLGGRWSHYVSVGKAAIGDGIGLLVPGAGVGIAVAEEALKHRQHKDERWAGFVVGTRSRIGGTNGG